MRQFGRIFSLKLDAGWLPHLSRALSLVMGSQLERELATMGQDIRMYGRVTRDQHKFIQDAYLAGQGVLTRQRIEELMGFKTKGILDIYFADLQKRERREGRPGSFGWESDPFEERARYLALMEESRFAADLHVEEVTELLEQIDLLKDAREASDFENERRIEKMEVELDQSKAEIARLKADLEDRASEY
jgi:hypothetical protein